jgi:CSLREA domain-containing protein
VRERRRADQPARRATRIVAGTGLSLGAALGMTATAEAADFTVTSLSDTGGGSATTLREAIALANNGGGNDRILFKSGLTGTITLNAAVLPLIDEPLQIVGPGAGALTVSGADTSRILYIYTTPGDDVTLSGLTLTKGNGGGGAIYSRNADLTIRGATVSGNKGSFAGALYSRTGATTIVDSTFSGNQSTSGGEGAIMSRDGGALTIRDSTISGNTSAAFAGAIYSLDEAATFERSTISNNKALSGGEGAVRSSGGGALTVRDSTISGNTASAFAGGVYSQNETDTFERSTISNNKALSGGEGGIMSDGGGPLTILASNISGNTASFGAGVYSNDEETTIDSSTISGNKTTLGATGGGILQSGLGMSIRNSTISGNSAGFGGGVYSDGTPDPVITNTVVADNSASSTGPDIQSATDTFHLAFSLVESTSGATVSSTVPGSNITGQDPKLGPLANNGGPTLTQALLPGSPALDKGSTSVATDERGAPRPFNLPGVPSSSATGADGADIGAYERVLCAGVAVNRIGTAGKDKHLGTAGRDGILGLGGNDRLLGKAGNDALCGGAGKDLLKGGKGRDKLLGQAGRDRLIGGPGRDKLKGGPGRDRQRQ